MPVIETRTVRVGMTRRRYQLPSGRRRTTYELPDSVLKAIGMKRVLKCLEQWQRAEAVRERRDLIVQRLASGEKPLAIAHDLGIAEQSVTRIRRLTSSGARPA